MELQNEEHVARIIQDYARSYLGKPLVYPNRIFASDRWQADKPNLIRHIATTIKRHRDFTCICQARQIR